MTEPDIRPEVRAELRPELRAEIRPEICVVIPAKDEVAAIGGLVAEIVAVLKQESFTIIVVDDGSSDGTGAQLELLARRYPELGWLRHDIALGQSAAIRTGVRAARAPVIVTLDGDGQNPPDQIPLLLSALRAPGAEGVGLVQGERAGRQDTAPRRLASRWANRIRNAVLHDGVRDSGCGLKAFRRAAYLDLPYFDHIHRFMPAMMLREGWQVVCVPVTHRERRAGRSKYSNLGRALVGVVDLMGVAWLIRRSPYGQALARARAGNGAAINGAGPDGVPGDGRTGDGRTGGREGSRGAGQPQPASASAMPPAAASATTASGGALQGTSSTKASTASAKSAIPPTAPTKTGA